MRKTIKIILLIIAIMLILNGIFGLLGIESPIIDFFRETFPIIFGS